MQATLLAELTLPGEKKKKRFIPILRTGCFFEVSSGYLLPLKAAERENCFNSTVQSISHLPLLLDMLLSTHSAHGGIKPAMIPIYFPLEHKGRCTKAAVCIENWGRAASSM